MQPRADRRRRQGIEELKPGPACQVRLENRLPVACGEAGREIVDAKDMGHQLPPAAEILDQDGRGLGFLGAGDDQLQFLGRDDGFRAGDVGRGFIVRMIVDRLELFVVMGIGIDVRGAEKSSPIVRARLATNVIETEGVPDLLTEDVPLRVRVVVGWRVEAVSRS